MLCESCNETSPNPVSTVTVNQTTIELGVDAEEHEWSTVANGVDASFTMDDEFLIVSLVSIGGVVQSDNAYTISGTTFTPDDAPGNGERIIVRGFRETP